MVADQSIQMERSFPSSPPSIPYHIRRRKQSRMGRYLSRYLRSRSFDSRRSRSIHQLARANGHRPRASFLRKLTPHHGLNLHRQHHGKSIRESTGWHKIPKAQSASNQHMGAVSTERSTHSSPTYSGNSEQDSGLRFSPLLHEGPVATNPYSLPTDSNTMGTPRRRSLCPTGHPIYFGNASAGSQTWKH